MTTQLALLAVEHHPGAPLFWLTLTSLLLLVGATALITVHKVVPINRAVHDWQPQQPPADWAQLRNRWHHLHNQRTGWIVLALLAQVTGVLAH